MNPVFEDDRDTSGYSRCYDTGRWEILSTCSPRTRVIYRSPLAISSNTYRSHISLAQNFIGRPPSRCVIETPPAEVGFWQPSPQHAGLTADRSQQSVDCAERRF